MIVNAFFNALIFWIAAFFTEILITGAAVVAVSFFAAVVPAVEESSVLGLVSVVAGFVSVVVEDVVGFDSVVAVVLSSVVGLLSVVVVAAVVPVVGFVSEVAELLSVVPVVGFVSVVVVVGF